MMDNRIGCFTKSPLTLSLSPEGERTLELPRGEFGGPFSPWGEGQDEGVFHLRFARRIGSGLARASPLLP